MCEKFICDQCGKKFIPVEFQKYAKAKGLNSYCSYDCKTKSSNCKKEEKRKIKLKLGIQASKEKRSDEVRSVKNIRVNYRPELL